MIRMYFLFNSSVYFFSGGALLQPLAPMGRRPKTENALHFVAPVSIRATIDTDAVGRFIAL